MTAAAGQPPTGSIRTVVFDFDGVILESAEIKTEAFRRLFADLPEHLPAILRHHQQELGASRFEKFAWVYRELLGREIEPAESRRLGERYAELALAATLSCPLVAGAEETLRLLERRRVPAFIASGTPQEELEEIVRRRGLERYFVGVAGAPTPKPEILAGVARRLALLPGALLMVGDGHSDYRAARDCGAWFAARVTPTQEELFAGVDVPRVADLAALATRLEDWLAPGREGSARAAKVLDGL